MSTSPSFVHVGKLQKAKAVNFLEKKVPLRVGDGETCYIQLHVLVLIFSMSTILI